MSRASATRGRGHRLLAAQVRDGATLGLGLTLGVLLGASAFLLTGQEPLVALSLFVVLLLVLVIATLGGTLTPMLLEKIGIDPAVAMGPFVSTLSDVVALSIYLTVTTALLA